MSSKNRKKNKIHYLNNIFFSSLCRNRLSQSNNDKYYENRKKDIELLSRNLYNKKKPKYIKKDNYSQNTNTTSNTNFNNYYMKTGEKSSYENAYNEYNKQNNLTNNPISKNDIYNNPNIYKNSNM